MNRPTRVRVTKALTPQEAGWRQRLARNEPALLAAFTAWVTSLHTLITDSAISAAIVANATDAFDHILQAVAFKPNLTPIAEQEAQASLMQLVHDTDTELRLSLNLQDPNFFTAVERHEAQMVREVTAQTRRGIANMISRGYRNGTATDQVAQQIRASVGLTGRQANAVMSFAEAQQKTGAAPSVVADRSIRYAKRMQGRRALTIARTETARAATLGRLASYEQAADAGLFERSTAMLEWSSVQEDPDEICAQLNGEQVSFGDDFDGLMPPAHPMCRCSVFLVPG